MGVLGFGLDTVISTVSEDTASKYRGESILHSNER